MRIQDQFNTIAAEYDKNRRRFIPCFDDFYVKTTDLIASNIKLYLKGCEKILLIGNAGSNATEKLKDQLYAFLGDTEIISSGNINVDPAAIDALGADTAVVCVEEWQKSKHLDIVKELEKLNVSENRETGRPRI